MYNVIVMTTWKIQLSGMHCDGCVKSVSTALEAIDGIDQAAVSLEDQLALVSTTARLDPETIRSAIVTSGFHLEQLSRDNEVLPQPECSEPLTRAIRPASESFPHEANSCRLEFEIEGMHCAGCVRQVREALLAVKGVSQAGVNLATRQATVVMERSSSAELLIESVGRAGYSARPSEALPLQAARWDQRFDDEQRLWKNRCLLAILLTSLQLFLRFPQLSLAVNLETLLAIAAGVTIQVLVGGAFYRDAWRRLRAGTTSMDTLVAIGTTAAFCSAVPGLLSAGLSAGTAGLGMLHDAGMIFSFISLGRYLESRSRRRASRAVQQLMRRIPETATVQRDTLQTVSVADIQVGETLVIAAGQNIPLDGQIREGTSQLNESWLTGESMPVSRTVGEQVFAGTINGPGALQVEVTSRVEGTAFARVVELVNRLQQQPAPIQRIADRLVAVFVPLVLLIATATLAGWLLAGENQLALRCTIAVLVVACPCALGLATPIALLVAAGRGARIGLLIQQPESLEIAARLTTVVFDKTGTLTLGTPRLEELLVAESVDPSQLLAAVAAVERQSSHPLATAIVEEAELRHCPLVSASEVSEVAGEGIQGIVEGKTLSIGSDRILKQDIPGEADRERIEQLRQQGRSLVHVLVDGTWHGTCAIADVLRPESQDTVQELHQMGIRTILLSGDSPDVVARIGTQVGIRQWHAEVTPEGKCNLIRELKERGDSVAVVGDGINDAPALVAADVGIAIGSGADVAKQSADIVLIASDVSGVSSAIQLSRKTIRIIRQNLAWAVLYNICLLPLAAGIIHFSGRVGIPVWMAAMAMAASSLMVVLNSLRLTRTRLTTRDTPPPGTLVAVDP